MGSEVSVDNVKGARAGDVGFDDEGGLNVTFRGCQGADARNGVFSTFFYSRNVKYIDCIGTQRSSTAPMFRTYNYREDFDADGVEFVGGSFSFIDCIGSIDTAGGSNKRISITGARLSNCCLAFDKSSHHEIKIRHCSLSFTSPSAAPFAAIKVERVRSYNGSKGRITIVGNVVRSLVVQPLRSKGIERVNSRSDAAIWTIQENRVSGFDVPFSETAGVNDTID